MGFNLSYSTIFKFLNSENMDGEWRKYQHPNDPKSCDMMPSIQASTDIQTPQNEEANNWKKYVFHRPASHILIL